MKDFVYQVQRAATRCPLVGDSKAWIYHVWLVTDSDLSLKEFKLALIEANRAGLLTLGQADLPDKMPRHELRLSRTPYLNTEFHFVRVAR